MSYAYLFKYIIIGDTGNYTTMHLVFSFSVNGSFHVDLLNKQNILFSLPDQASIMAVADVDLSRLLIKVSFYAV